jgi:CheY-like chemotaxis protein
MPSILLVDDSGLFRDIGQKVQERLAYRVMTASSGGEALAVARRESPDLIFLDAEMSDMTGVDVCRVLKADSRFARTPVLIASNDSKSEPDGRRAGADGWLIKPLEEEMLLESIRRRLRLTPRDGNRAAADWSVTFWRDGVQHEGTLRDLSRGGFFIRTAAPHPVGARLEVSFAVPGRPGRTIVGEAIVVRLSQEPELGLGCRFFQISAPARGYLEECLKMLEEESQTA